MKKSIIGVVFALFFWGCSSDYSAINSYEFIEDALECSSDASCTTNSKWQEIETDSYGRLRHTKIQGNDISIYWEPYQVGATTMLAVRIQNKDTDKWHAPNLTEIGFFKAIVIQVYGNTFSNMILGPIMGFFAH